MPICNLCANEFDVEKAPGALMFGHPSTVKKAVPVWKAHICQPCEKRIVGQFKLQPEEFYSLDDLMKVIPQEFIQILRGHKR